MKIEHIKPYDFIQDDTFFEEGMDIGKNRKKDIGKSRFLI